ncbi:uncharacterized protein LOC124892577, partial [Capsicum annuum]|uniref:uncharacterized protein LOC124892577 n=1 Tax=Capsicum annuum TaxID=4072 RepID=UPI001FB1253E
MLKDMPMTSITHLSSVGSDHCPLLLEMEERVESRTKYFKFLDCWVDLPIFLQTVETCWQRHCEGSPRWRFQQKLKRLTATLSQWSKEVFGDIYGNVKNYEENVKVAEENLILHSTDENRQEFHKTQAEYIRHLKVEDVILRPKSHLHWFKYGDANSSYFHAFIKGRRRRLFIHKVKNEAGDWIHGDVKIAAAAVTHRQNILTGTADYIPEEMPAHIPKLISEDQTNTLQAIPTLEKVKIVVFLMSTHSAVGLDGMNVKFFQAIPTLEK